MKDTDIAIPDGWHLDETSGCLVRDTIHRMGRRCRNWDYAGEGCYLVTMTLRDRSRPLLGNVLFTDEAFARALAYMADNPRRLLEKREHSEYFRVVRDLAVRSSIDGLKNRGMVPAGLNRLVEDATTHRGNHK